jgi:ABC-type Mn2+/Zn2+ transport system permease subunit
MLDWLTDPFAGDIARRALLETALLALACGPLGVWVLLGRQSYTAEAMGHGMLPGLVVAALAGAPLAAGAAGGVIVTVAAITAAGADRRIGADTAPAVAITGLTGLGALLALSADAPPRLESLLFGDLLGTTGRDVALAACAAVAVGAALAVARRPLLAAFFGVGSGSATATVIVLILLGTTTAVAAPALGSVLLLALLLAPAAAALQLARSVPAAVALAAALAAAAGAAGILVSHHLDVAAGASVALCALAPWGAALLLTARPRSESIARR